MALFWCRWAPSLDGRGAVKLVGYFDESEDDSTFCLAGWFAPSHHWAPFEDTWSSILHDEGITPEFKASDCVNRRGAFEEWTDRSKRQRVERRLIGVLTDNPYLSPSGLLAVFDRGAYKEILAPHIKSQLRGFDKPWLLAFVQLTLRMVEGQEVANRLSGLEDRIELHFDEQDEFSGRAQRLVKEARQSDPRINRLLGDVTFGDSRGRPGLQMADMLAYEARRAVTALFAEDQLPRDEWTQIQNAKLPNGGPRVWPFLWDRELQEFYRDGGLLR